MSYEDTKVPISHSQSAIRQLIYAHGGTGVSLMSQPPREGFDALVTIADTPYHVRVMATCKAVNAISSQGKRRTESSMQSLREAEERRVWRVLYWHLKAMFEAADSGVINMLDVIMPYVVTRDGRTLSEHLVPRMAEMANVDASKLLKAGE